MWQHAVNVFLVFSSKCRELYIPVKNIDPITLPGKFFDKLHRWAVAEIVGPRLKAQADNSNILFLEACDEPKAANDMGNVAVAYGIDDWGGDIVVV